jgi:putative transposase
LAFVTKYRREAFTDEMPTRSEGIMHEVCEGFEAELKQFNWP